MKYILLLRGINVGGNNKVSMKELKAALEQNGYKDVTTYINSGNIIFSNKSSDLDFMKKNCEAIILEKFNLSLSVMIISEEDLCEALKNAPDWWDSDAESKHNAIFVIPPATVEEVLKEVGEIKPEYEKVAAYGRVIFWSAPIKTFSRTRWSRIVGNSSYKVVTIRNSNTFKKLAEMCKAG
ncbi:MAG: DUF1697 domain-containing protein [Chloroflexota bacterium]